MGEMFSQLDAYIAKFRSTQIFAKLSQNFRKISRFALLAKLKTTFRPCLIPNKKTNFKITI